MLIQFIFRNFRSFRDETTLDLSAARMTEFNDRVVTVGGERILTAAAVYGANASGKSNVYRAFEFMSSYVADSFRYGDDDDSYAENRPKPFVFSEETAHAETSFEVYFALPGDPSEKIYDYGFCVGDQGVTEEWLNTKSRSARKFSSVFYRDEDTMDLKGLPKSSRTNLEVAIEKQVLIVSLGAKLKIAKCKQIRDWFAGNAFADFGDPVTSLFLSRRLPVGFESDPEVRRQVASYFASFDETIRDFRIERVHAEASDSRDDRYRIWAIHQKEDSDQYAEIPLEEESAGTLKMFALYPQLQSVLHSGGVYCIDELNARLHPLLVRNFILTFLNPEINTRHAQLIFTTHDTWQLSNQLLRRDEIWFTDKNDKGESSLYSLADFVDEDGDRIRKDENYERNYLLGKYGAIPELKAIRI